MNPYERTVILLWIGLAGTFGFIAEHFITKYW